MWLNMAKIKGRRATANFLPSTVEMICREKHAGLILDGLVTYCVCLKTLVMYIVTPNPIT